MDPEKQSIAQVREIFSEAQLLPAGKERDTFVKRACGGNEKLKEEVTSLLEVYQTSCGFLEQDASGAAFFDTPDLSGTQINHYQLFECIGEGGFGEVYRAEQIEPLRREVALKVIKLGMDTKNVVARFKAEQQALARMNHPNIAQVYDAGATESGRPYFVMELVRGVPILEYCDKHRFSLAERIALFQQVCEGIQHAHKKGILHRDLKPSNILVSEDEGKPVAKIIDFGVAKSLEGRLTEKVLATLEEVLIGTPMYMSPEQLEGRTSELDARSDIYSLGVILYELVAGASPLAHQTPTSLTLADMRAALHNRDLPRPSRRFQSLGNKTSVIARRRNIRVPALKRQLRGDLDWIVMKAIEMEPDHRYEDSLVFSDDLTRFLGSRPVSAGRPRLTRRIRKFFRRHKTTRYVTCSVTATVLICITIMASIIYHSSRPPETLLEQRGWKLQQFYEKSKLGSNGFAIRPDGSVLIVNEWGSEPKGLYLAQEGGIWCKDDAFSIDDAYVDPEDAIELPDAIYVTVNGAEGTVYKIPKEGGKPELFCNRLKIDNPYRIMVVPDNFTGRNVDPGDLLVFDNAGSGRNKTTIWAVNRSSGHVRALIEGNTLFKGFLGGGFTPDGMLYAGLNTHESDEVSILRISPEGNAKVVFNNFYPVNEGNKVAEHPKAVHPITGELFFGAQNRIYAFFPEQTSPRLVITKATRAIRWAPDGTKLYILDDNAIWTLSGPGIESQPISTEKSRSIPHSYPGQITGKEVGQADSSANLVGTWDCVNFDSIPRPDEPAVTALRLVLTPQNDAFLTWSLVEGPDEIWTSKYRIDGNLFYEHFLIEPVAYEYHFENGLLIMKYDNKNFIFEAVE